MRPAPSPAPTSAPGPDDSSDDNDGNHTDFDRDEDSERASSVINSGIKAVEESWKPVTPDEKKRYACVGRETVRYAAPKENAYQVDIKNAMQGPMCFRSFESVLGDYTIGRTYNIYPPSGRTFSMDKEIELTIEIPSELFRENREYKMICVTKGGQPIVYSDLDRDPETIFIFRVNCLCITGICTILLLCFC